MSSPQDCVFNLPELMESILVNIKPQEILITVQKVSKQWKDMVEGSPKIQKALFLRKGIKPLSNMFDYTKNRYAGYVVPPFFNLQFRSEGVYHLHTKKSTVTLKNLNWHLNDQKRELWLRDGASWRKMQLAQPPIKKLHWQVRRQDQDGRITLPGTVAELEFPEGLLMGDYYDLILGTQGTHEIVWPLIDKYQAEKGSPEPNDIAQWSVDRQWAAWDQRAILVKQNIDHDFADYRHQRDVFWNARDLQECHSNLRKVETLKITENGGNVSWTYKTETSNTAEAMRLFLHAAQTPLEPPEEPEN